MKLRNGKHYLNPRALAPRREPEFSPHTVSIINLLKTITDVYDKRNTENKINITENEFINQQIRDYREFFYLVGYYFESLKHPTFNAFWICCKKRATSTILKLTKILNNEPPNVILTGNDKANAIGLLKDLDKFLKRFRAFK